MKAFARLIASVFMVLGLIIILGGVAVLVSGAFGQVPKTPSAPSLIPDMTGLIILSRIIIGSAVSLQGLFLAAIGLVLWLLAGIYEQTERTGDALFALMRRNSQPKQQG